MDANNGLFLGLPAKPAKKVRTAQIKSPPPPQLWDNLSIPPLAWAQQYPDKFMAFLLVAQTDFSELAEMLK